MALHIHRQGRFNNHTTHRLYRILHYCQQLNLCLCIVNDHLGINIYMSMSIVPGQLKYLTLNKNIMTITKKKNFQVYKQLQRTIHQQLCQKQTEQEAASPEVINPHFHRMRSEACDDLTAISLFAGVLPSSNNQGSHREGYCLVTVHTHGDFLILPILTPDHWDQDPIGSH